MHLRAEAAAPDALQTARIASEIMLLAGSPQESAEQIFLTVGFSIDWPSSEFHPVPLSFPRAHSHRHP